MKYIKTDFPILKNVIIINAFDKIENTVECWMQSKYLVQITTYVFF